MVAIHLEYSKMFGKPGKIGFSVKIKHTEKIQIRRSFESKINSNSSSKIVK
jgi:hypothetical protein